MGDTNARQRSEAAAGECPAPLQDVYDLVIVGSGGGGMTAAAVAAAAGLRVLVLEKSDVVGGTTALSGGVAWLPGNPLMAAAGKPDSRAEVERYLSHVVGTRLRRDVVKAYLDNAPAMVEFLHARTAMRFDPLAFPDYKPELPGGVTGGRSLVAAPYDARQLGPSLGMLRRPLDFTTAFGGIALDFMDIHHLLNAGKARRSLLQAVRLVGRYARDRVLHGRGMRLTLGNAMMGRLLRSALDLKVDIRTGARVVALDMDGGRIAGVTVAIDGRQVQVRARRGVLLASGGFANDPALRERYLPYPDRMRTMCVVSCTGDALRMGSAVGAHVDDDLWQACLGFPISMLRHPDGREENCMHVGSLDRNPGGVIAIDGQGRRFVNEAAPYNDFLHALTEAQAVPAWFICDHRRLRKGGLGLYMRPTWLRRLQTFLDAGYIVRGATLEELAGKLGVPADQLEATVRRANEQAVRGVDDDFGKGKSLYDRSGTDPTRGPNPNLAPMGAGPYYAVRVDPGNLGTFVGLKIDGEARVLRADGSVIDGLYACGLDAAAVFSGTYPGGGSSIGPSMVMGYIAARHAAQAGEEGAAEAPATSRIAEDDMEPVAPA